jgi:Putative sensor
MDPATWRDLAYLLGLWAPLAALDLTVLTVWVASLAEITVPIWYRIPWMSYHGTRIHGVQLVGYFPDGPYGHGAVGVFIGSLPSALTVAGVSFAVFLLSNYAVVATARAHARVARSLLGPRPRPAHGRLTAQR